MNEKLLNELKGIYTKLGGEEDLTSENSLIVILDKIYKQMGGEKDLKQFSVPEVIDLIEDEVGGGGSSDSVRLPQVTITINIDDISHAASYEPNSLAQMNNNELIILDLGSPALTKTFECVVLPITIEDGQTSIRSIEYGGAVYVNPINGNEGYYECTVRNTVNCTAVVGGAFTVIDPSLPASLTTDAVYHAS